MELKNCKIEKVKTCEPDESIVSVAKRLKEGHERRLFVVENGKPVGVLSASDIVNRVVAEEKDPKNSTADEVMNTPVIYKDVTDSTGDAYMTMVKENIFLLPVCENDVLKGGVTMQTLIKHIMERKKEK